MRKTLTTVVLVLSLFWGAPVLHAGDRLEIFSATQLDPTPSPSDGRYEETYTVNVDMELLRDPAQTIILNLPGQEAEIVELQHWEPRRGYIQIPDPDDPTGFGSINIPDPNASPEDFWWRWYGQSANYTVALTTVDGIVAGRIVSAARRYAVEPLESGRTKLGVVNREFWRVHPVEAGAGDSQLPASSKAAVLHSTSREAPAASGSGAWDPLCLGPPPEGPNVIDVLLFYTTSILNYYFGNTSAVHAALQSSLDDANQALRHSGVTQVVFSPRGPELLPNPPDFNYDNASIEDALYFATGVERLDVYPFYIFHGNPYVLERRNTQWADIVAIARDDAQATCGFSYVNRYVVNNDYATEPGPDFEKLAYLIFDPNCNAVGLNLAHELGHQMGVEHDPTNYEFSNVAGIDPSCPWSFGHKRSIDDPRFRFRTVMAYWQNQYFGPGGPPSCGADLNCPLIEAFSTPLREWAGDAGGGGSPPFGVQPLGTVPGAFPIGVAVPQAGHKRANAADTIKRIAPIAQDYRPRPPIIFADGFQ
jgi:hypothetical protein